MDESRSRGECLKIDKTRGNLDVELHPAFRYSSGFHVRQKIGRFGIWSSGSTDKERYASSYARMNGRSGEQEKLEEERRRSKRENRSDDAAAAALFPSFFLFPFVLSPRSSVMRSAWYNGTNVSNIPLIKKSILSIANEALTLPISRIATSNYYNTEACIHKTVYNENTYPTNNISNIMKESLREFDILHTHFLFNKRSRYTIPGLIIQAFTSFHNAYELAKKGREVIRILPSSTPKEFYPPLLSSIPKCTSSRQWNLFRSKTQRVDDIKISESEGGEGISLPSLGGGGSPDEIFFGAARARLNSRRAASRNNSRGSARRPAPSSVFPQSSPPPIFSAPTFSRLHARLIGKDCVSLGWPRAPTSRSIYHRDVHSLRRASPYFGLAFSGSSSYSLSELFSPMVIPNTVKLRRIAEFRISSATIPSLFLSFSSTRLCLRDTLQSLDKSFG